MHAHAHIHTHMHTHTHTLIHMHRGRNKIVKALGHDVLALKILLGHYINVSGHVNANINQKCEVLHLSHDTVWCTQCKSHSTTSTDFKCLVKQMQF